MATNEILQFASQDTGSNLLTQTEYEGDAQRIIGHQPGIARSRLENKVLRQASLMASGLAQFIVDNNGSSVTDSLSAQDIADALSTTVGRIGGTNMSPVSYTATMFDYGSINTIIDTTRTKGNIVRINGSNVTLTIGSMYFVLNAKAAINTGVYITGRIGVTLDGYSPLSYPIGMGQGIIVSQYDSADVSVSNGTAGATFNIGFDAKAKTNISANTPAAYFTVLLVSIQ